MFYIFILMTTFLTGSGAVMLSWGMWASWGKKIEKKPLPNKRSEDKWQLTVDNSLT